jgi:hypothetical protein
MPAFAIPLFRGRCKAPWVNDLAAVGVVGFEQSMARDSRAPSPLIQLVPRGGIEPPTP